MPLATAGAAAGRLVPGGAPDELELAQPFCFFRRRLDRVLSTIRRDRAAGTLRLFPITEHAGLKVFRRLLFRNAVILGCDQHVGQHLFVGRAREVLHGAIRVQLPTSTPISALTQARGEATTPSPNASRNANAMNIHNARFIFSPCDIEKKILRECGGGED